MFFMVPLFGDFTGEYGGIQGEYSRSKVVKEYVHQKYTGNS